MYVIAWMCVRVSPWKRIENAIVKNQSKPRRIKKNGNHFSLVNFFLIYRVRLRIPLALCSYLFFSPCKLLWFCCCFRCYSCCRIRHMNVTRPQLFISLMLKSNYIYLSIASSLSHSAIRN